MQYLWPRVARSQVEAVDKASPLIILRSVPGISFRYLHPVFLKDRGMLKQYRISLIIEVSLLLAI